MHPILLKVGPFTVYSYGMMVAIGFAAAVFFIYRRAAKFHIDKNKMIDLCIIILISGVIGARFLYVLLNLSYYTANPIEIVKLSKGGLVWYGGFLTGLVALIIYLRKAKLDFWAVMDLVAPYIALAQAFGRIGCLLNGCCYGIEAGPGCMFAVRSVNDPTMRYPVQIYSAIALFLIFLILRVWQDRKHFVGEIFLGYCALYSYKRFLIEFMRADNPKIWFGLTMSQLISIAVLLTAIIIFLYKAAKWKRERSHLR